MIQNYIAFKKQLQELIQSKQGLEFKEVHLISEQECLILCNYHHMEIHSYKALNHEIDKNR